MALSGTGSGTNYVWRSFGPYTRAGVSPWSRTNGMQITLSGWVRLRASPSSQQPLLGIGNYGDSTRFILSVDTNFVFGANYVNNSGGASAAATSPTNSAAVGQWVHVMGTINCTSNPQATLFINGASYAATSGADSSSTPFNNVTILRRPNGTSLAAPTTTDVAEVAVYAGLLSAGDAEALRLGQNPLSVEGHRLLAYFPLRGDVQDRSPYATGLTQAAAYTLAWSDHPPVQQEPRRRIVRAISEVSVSLTGAAITASPGDLLAALAAAMAGQDAASAAGTVSSALAVTATGAAMTVSAGSLAYSIAFSLTGAAATSASGTLTGDASTTDRTLTGIQMTALPGNVRVTGGTRWYPQAPRTETPGSVLGNTLPPPPRATGDDKADLRALNQWVNTLYDQWVKGLNLMGKVQDHDARIARLENEE